MACIHTHDVAPNVASIGKATVWSRLVGIFTLWVFHGSYDGVGVNERI